MRPVTVVPTAGFSDEKPVAWMPLRGTLGSLSAQTLLTVLALQKASGTLYLSRAEAGTLLSLQGGEPRAQTDFGAALGAAGTFDLSASGAQFSFWPSASTGAPGPSLPSRYPDASGPLWALPALAEHALLSTAETELRGLVARLAADAFTGALVLEASNTQANTDPPPYGLLLFQQGQLGGAVRAGVHPQLQSGSAALRTLVQPARVGAALTLYALPEIVVASLLGCVLGLELSGGAGELGNSPGSGGVPSGFSGLELSPVAARYYRGGSAYLELPRPQLPAGPTTLGLFAACQRAPSLALPGEPHGWEGRCYGLTLRGRDALNPLTELSMKFSGDFGRAGKRVLEGFRRDLSVEAAAEALALDLNDLGSLVERLEQEGFIRAVGDAARDVSPTPHLQPR